MLLPDGWRRPSSTEAYILGQGLGALFLSKACSALSAGQYSIWMLTKSPPSPNLLRADHKALEVLRPRIITRSCDSSLRTPRAVFLLTCLLVVSFVSLCMMACMDSKSAGRIFPRSLYGTLIIFGVPNYFFSGWTTDAVWTDSRHRHLVDASNVRLAWTNPPVLIMNLDLGGASSSLFARGCLISICA